MAALHVCPRSRNVITMTPVMLASILSNNFIQFLKIGSEARIRLAKLIENRPLIFWIS